MNASRTFRHVVLAVHGLIACVGFRAAADGELAVNTPTERVRAAVQLYLEGDGQEQIAAPMLVKLGEVAKTELQSMKQTATDPNEAAAIAEILQVYFVSAKPAKSHAAATVGAQPKVRSQKMAVLSQPKQKIAEFVATPRRLDPPKIRGSVTGVTNPLQPSAMRFLCFKGR